MGRSRYKVYQEDYPYFLTSSVIKWNPVFSIPETSQIVLDSLLFQQEQRQVTLYAYVIMKDHIHLIASGKGLSEKMRLFKSYTARKIIDLLEQQHNTLFLRYLGKNSRTNFQLWQDGFHPKQLVGDKMMIQKIEYIHANPVKYVENPEDWKHSSIHNYLGNSSAIPITCF